MATVSRFQRMQEVLGRRLGHVRCAAESLYHRHNVSAVLRTCESLGMQHVHLVGEEFQATRGASRGAERWLSLHRHATAEQAIEAIRQAGFALWVADLADDAVAPETVPLDRPLCLWVGAELEGVSEVAREAADGVLTVPMRGFTQSLNVSVAAALALRPVAERVRALGEAALLAPSEREAILRAWVEREDPHGAAIEARAALDLDL